MTRRNPDFPAKDPSGRAGSVGLRAHLDVSEKNRGSGVAG